MINLALTKRVSEGERKRWRKIVMTVTTVVLGGYLVVGGGILGWKGFWGARERGIASEAARLTDEIKRNQDKVGLVRRVEREVREASLFLEKRPGAGAKIAGVKGIGLSQWTYGAEEEMQAVIEGDAAAEVAQAIRVLTEKYGRVRVVAVGLNAGTWMAEVNYRDGQ